MDIKHAVFPTPSPSVTFANWDQEAWDKFAERHRPSGYTGGIHDSEAYQLYLCRLVDASLVDTRELANRVVLTRMFPTAIPPAIFDESAAIKDFMLMYSAKHGRWPNQLHRDTALEVFRKRADKFFDQISASEIMNDHELRGSGYRIV
jgi:hypothetical protein